jgi:hypothetical protein
MLGDNKDFIIGIILFAVVAALGAGGMYYYEEYSWNKKFENVVLERVINRQEGEKILLQHLSQTFLVIPLGAENGEVFSLVTFNRGMDWFLVSEANGRVKVKGNMEKEFQKLILTIDGMSQFISYKNRVGGIDLQNPEKRKFFKDMLGLMKFSMTDDNIVLPYRK